MATKRIPMMDLRRHLSEIVERVYRGRDRFTIIQRQGKDVAALISLEDLRRLEALEAEEESQSLGVAQPPPPIELRFRFRVRPTDVTDFDPMLVDWFNVAERAVDPLLSAARLTIEEQPNASGNSDGNFDGRYVVVGVEALELDGGDGVVLVERRGDEMGDGVTLHGTCLALSGAHMEGPGVYFDLVARETRQVC